MQINKLGLIVPIRSVPLRKYQPIHKCVDASMTFLLVNFSCEYHHDLKHFAAQRLHDVLYGTSITIKFMFYGLQLSFFASAGRLSSVCLKRPRVGGSMLNYSDSVSLSVNLCSSIAKCMIL